MLLHHLHGLHILMGDIVGGQAIPTPDKVVAIYIKFIDGFPLIFNRAVILHLYSGQTFNHVDDGVVGGIGVALYVKHQRVAPGIDVGSLHNHVV